MLPFDLLVWIGCDMIGVDDPATARGVFHAQVTLVGHPILRRLRAAALNRWSLDPIAQARAAAARRG